MSTETVKSRVGTVTLKVYQKCAVTYTKAMSIGAGAKSALLALTWTSSHRSQAVLFQNA